MSDIDLKSKKDRDESDQEAEEKKKQTEEEEETEEDSDKELEDTEKDASSEKDKSEEKDEKENTEDEEKVLPPKTDKKKLPLRARLKAFFANPKKRLIFIIIIGLIMIAAVALGAYFMTHENIAEEKPTTVPTAEPEAVKYPAVLDGVMTDQDSANRHPLAIMVENHPDARPQAGLDKASIVYEAIAEGGITRFLAVYGTHEAEKVGPVRSARTYYVDWAQGYYAYYAHVGGNMDALDKIPKDKVYDLDQFRYPSPYWRESSRGIASEHTMFTSTLKLREQASKNGYPTANNFSILKFKDDPNETEKAALAASQKVTVDFSSANFRVVFDYDKATNSYKRSMDSKPHVDRVTKEQLNPKNIVVMTVKRRPTVTRINETGYIMDTQGSGKAKIYLDGKEISGTWKKAAASDRELFYDDAGTEIVFNRGQIWISVIPPEGSVTAI